MIAEIIAWIVTFFRASGMLMKRADLVKYFVSLDNLFWFISGILTKKNTPLMVSNGLCLLVMGYELIKESNVFKRR